jgi:hypothetical protein
MGMGTSAVNGILKPWPQKTKKYLVLQLCKNGKQYSRAVHILVAQAFLPNPKHFPQVNHKDADKNNCGVTNLEWRTQVGNMRHASKLGLIHGKGAYYHKREKRWIATYCPEPWKRVVIGRYKTEAEALLARQKAVSLLPHID